MLDKEERSELSQLVLGEDGLAPGMAFDVAIDYEKWQKARAIMDREFERSAAEGEVDKDVVYTMYLLHYLIYRSELDQDPITASLAMEMEHWYEDRMTDLATDAFYRDWSRETVRREDLKAINGKENQ